MSSWNRSTSYANCIKLYNIDKPEDVDNDTWWEMLWITEWKEKLSDLLEDFGRKHEWQWQAGINGRSISSAGIDNCHCEDTPLPLRGKTRGDEAILTFSTAQ
jgi:hypothetical protein